MAFKSIGQKYGFVSAGDAFRQRIAEADQRAEAERQKAENAEAEIVHNRADTQKVLREMGLSKEQIAEMEARLDALRQSRLSKEQISMK